MGVYKAQGFRVQGALKGLRFKVQGSFMGSFQGSFNSLGFRVPF